MQHSHTHTRSLDVTVTDADKSKIEETIEPKVKEARIDKSKIDVAKIGEATDGPKMVGSDYLTKIMQDMFDLSENKRWEHNDEDTEEIAARRMVVPNAVNIVKLQEDFENLRTETDKTLSGKQSGQRGESFRSRATELLSRSAQHVDTLVPKNETLEAEYG